MKITKLNLANELNNKIQYLKKVRTNYKQGFDISVENLKEENSGITIELSSYFLLIDLEQFIKLIELRIINLDFKIKELENKFKQL